MRRIPGSEPIAIDRDVRIGTITIYRVDTDPPTPVVVVSALQSSLLRPVLAEYEQELATGIGSPEG